MTYNINKNIL